MKIILLIFLILVVLSACNKVDDIINPDDYKAPEIESINSSVNTANPGDTVLVWVVASNPEEGLLTYSWQKSGGKFIEPADQDTAYWIAPLQGGTYEVKASVSNEKKNKSITKTINVISAQKAIVNILNPKSGEYYVLGQTISIQAEAYHDNDLSKVELFVNDSLVEQKDFSPDNIYNFSVTTNASMIGQTSLKVTAEVFGQPDNRNSESVSVYVEGILPKKGL
ncbi:MAG: hypothetical protein KDF60_19590 [Calditrichaeota bacterium]|nr:hypothetical protein [Calditrichota bacterium]